MRGGVHNQHIINIHIVQELNLLFKSLSFKIGHIFYKVIIFSYFRVGILFDGLVYILNKEIIRQRRRITTAIFDLDGTLTEPHNPEMYELFWRTVISLLPPELKKLRKKLEEYNFEDLRGTADVPLGWTHDMKLGYLLMPDSHGKILESRRGDQILSKKEISSQYGGIIPLLPPENLDHIQPRFLHICDVFDYMESLIKNVLSQMQGLPRKSTIYHINRARYLAHNDEKRGFKTEMLKNPDKYWIRYDPKLKDFLNELKEIYKMFVLTSSKPEYAWQVLRIMGLEGCFHDVMAEFTKPDCFYDGHFHNRILLNRLARQGVKSPKNVFYSGDHLYKDGVYANKFGFFTALRMTPRQIHEVKRKLKKYASIEFQRDGAYYVAHPTSATPQKLSRLNNFLFHLYSHVHVLATDVQNFRPILLY